MKNYQLQPGCHNCRHRFEYVEHDHGVELFCTLDAPERPQCGSVMLDEVEGFMLHDNLNDAQERWDAWSENRGVEPAGKCDGFEAEVETTLAEEDAAV